jgi:endonuclease/exonuclease/phosphatase family metal-dependent hydrolase
MQLLLANWTDSAGANAPPTIPSANPRRRIDYILVRPKERWRTVQSRVLDEAVASDHRAVLTVLEWGAK